VGAKGGARLGEALKLNDTLTSLDLAGTEGEKGGHSTMRKKTTQLFFCGFVAPCLVQETELEMKQQQNWQKRCNAAPASLH